MNVYRRALSYFKPFSGAIAAGLTLTLLGIGLNLLKPWPAKLLIDGVLAPDASPEARQIARNISSIFEGWTPPALIALFCTAIVVIHLLWGVTRMCGQFLHIRTGLLALLNLRTQIYGHLQSLPLKYHDRHRSSDSSFRVAYDSQSIQTIYNQGFTGGLTSLVTMCGVLAIMFAMDWLLTLAAMAILPLVLITVRSYAGRIRRQSTVIQEKESALLSTAQEGLSSVRAVHAFGRENYEVEQFKSDAGASLRANLQMNMLNLTSALAMGTVMAVGTAVTYYIASRHILDGTLTIGDLIVFLSYVTMLYTPIESLTYTAWGLQRAAAAAQRCFEVLDRDDDVPEAPDARPLPAGNGEIVFDNVSFSYEQRRPVLEQIDLALEPGKTVAFVGGTGAGKSTLLSLVPRFYDVDTGRMLVNGADVREVRKQSLREAISIVLQDTLLFSTSVRENIAYGRPGAGDAEIIEAAKRAQAHDFILKLDHGYESPVGERGNRLSVGQRQRIGIARAFLKNAPILLLDEPTSALDPQTERAIMETIETLMEGRTTLIVTHRIATVHHSDLIVVLKDGRIAEKGTGAELLARDGAYAALYHAGSAQKPAAV